MLVAVAVTLIVLVAGVRVRYAGRSPGKVDASNCSPELWKHVYSKDRLRVIEECTAVEGRVVAMHKADDGDLHISLDPDKKSVLNLINVAHTHRTLVVEVVCDHTPEESEAKAACKEFQSNVSAPSVGDRVRVTGSYVTDIDNGWNEVHPVSRIEVLR